METLADSLPKEIARNMKLIEQYNEIGPVGNFAKGMIQLDIARANKAIMEGDTVEMIKIYEILKENE